MSQMALDLGNEIIVDLFAGGGGASLGIEWGLGRPVDVAVNHDPQAVAMHRANHPETTHYCESVFSVRCDEATGRRPVGLLWASPDCTHHSKAKGGKPVSSKRRGLAWVVIKWARRCRPRVIMLENVEEFEDWGPLTEEGKPCPVRKGQTFMQWKHQLERQGYRVEWRRLRACDYGTPTIRRRLFVIARRDDRPIVWPDATHGPADSLPVQQGKLAAYRTAAECIDWSIEAPSIFTRKKPLAENTCRRIARGIVRYALEDPQPFIIPVTHAGDSRCHGMSEPVRTVTCANRGEQDIATPYFIGIDHGSSGAGCAWNGKKPLTTITTENRHALVTAFLAKHYGGNYQGPGVDLNDPAGTVTTKDHHGLVAAHLLNMKGTTRRDQAMEKPAPTITAGGNHASLVASFLAPYYGSGSGLTGRDLRDPAPTATTTDRLQLVTVQIDGQTYVLSDIGMRMLQPRELFRTQGFPDSYIIDQGPDGKRLSKSAQVRMCGNSVPPQWPAALTRANFTHERQLREVA